jgi:hypothetical protein
MRINIRVATGILAALWIGGFALILLTGYLMHHGGKITDKNFPLFLDQINRTFEHYVGLILGFLLGTRKAKNANAKSSGGVFLVAAIISTGWIAMVAYDVFDAAAGNNTVQAAMKHMDQMSARMAWIVAPVIGYYFGDRIEEK